VKFDAQTPKSKLACAQLNIYEQNFLNPRRDHRGPFVKEFEQHYKYDYVIIFPTDHGLQGFCLLKDETLSCCLTSMTCG